MAWIYLVAAGLLEVVWASLFKLAFKNDHLITALTIGAMYASFALLWMAMRAIPMGTAYAVWTGIGAAGAALIGVWLLGESASVVRLACIGCIILGVVGLKYASA